MFLGSSWVQLGPAGSRPGNVDNAFSVGSPGDGRHGHDGHDVMTAMMDGERKPHGLRQKYTNIKMCVYLVYILYIYIYVYICMYIL